MERVDCMGSVKLYVCLQAVEVSEDEGLHNDHCVLCSFYNSSHTRLFLPFSTSIVFLVLFTFGDKNHSHGVGEFDY